MDRISKKSLLKDFIVQTNSELKNLISFLEFSLYKRPVSKAFVRDFEEKVLNLKVFPCDVVHDLVKFYISESSSKKCAYKDNH